MHVSPHSPQPGSVQFQFLVPTFLILPFFLYSTIRQGINYSAKILLANLTLQSTLLHGHKSTNIAINEKCKLGCLLAWIISAPWLEQSTTEKDILNSNGLKGPYNLLHFPFACILTLINERILYAVAYTINQSPSEKIQTGAVAKNSYSKISKKKMPIHKIEHQHSQFQAPR